jgi:hypothetical protein
MRGHEWHMLVFLDFEASSLSNHSYPIEVGWVFEDGRSDEYLIRPAANWTDWDPRAQAIHNIPRERLVREGVSHIDVARRMVADLAGHDLLASAPSWDGKWLSALLRAASFPRGSLRLRGSDDAHRECAMEILAPVVPADLLIPTVDNLLVLTGIRAAGQAPAHRALADAVEDHQRWLAVRAAAQKLADEYATGLQSDRKPL